MIIGVDFDGTIIELVDYPATEYTFKQDAEKALHILAKKHTLILSTARHGWYYDAAVDFIKQHNLPIEICDRKPIADIYIDDRNYKCPEIVWADIIKDLA